MVSVHSILESVANVSHIHFQKIVSNSLGNRCPLGLPAQNMNSNSGEFVEFMKVFDVAKCLGPKRLLSLFLYIALIPSVPGSL